MRGGVRLKALSAAILASCFSFGAQQTFAAETPIPIVLNDNDDNEDLTNKTPTLDKLKNEGILIGQQDELDYSSQAVDESDSINSHSENNNNIVKDQILDLGTITDPTGTSAEHTQIIGGAGFNNPAGITTSVESKSFENNTTSVILESTTTDAKYVDILGGALYNAGEITDISADFIGNGFAVGTNAVEGSIKAYTYGGAIYNEGNITITTTNSDLNFSNNTADIGGAIYNTGNMNINAINGHKVIFDNNIASSYGGTIWNSGTLNINGSTANSVVFSNNSILTSGAGSAIYTMGKTTINNAEFYNNNANWGAIDANVNSNVTITNSYFHDNTASVGGAIHISEAKTTGAQGYVSVADSIFENNHSTSAGGAIQAYGSLDVTDSDFINNSTELNGGAIEAMNGVYSFPYAVNILAKNKNVNFIGNTANDSGGAILVSSMATTADQDYLSIKSTGNNRVIFENNSVVSNDSTVNVYGGAIANKSRGTQGTSANISEISADFIGNYAQASSGNAYGGAIYNIVGTDASGNKIEDSGKIGVITGNFINNYASSESGKAYGGAIYNEGTIGSIVNSTFTGNTASQGGAIYNTGHIGNIDNVVYTNNNITDTTGGFIYNTAAGTIDSINADILNNTVNSTSSTIIPALIYNQGHIGSVKGSWIGNTFNFDTDTSGDDGGLIYAHGASAVIDSIDVVLKDNSILCPTTANSTPSPLIFVSHDGYIGNIRGTFSNNRQELVGSNRTEGSIIGIWNNGHIGSIDGTFTNNSSVVTSGAGGAWGAVVTLNTTGTNIVDSINGIFSNNYSKTVSGSPLGGTISVLNTTSNIGTIGTADNHATFTNNYAKSSSGSAYGGAIYNVGIIDSIYADFTGNYAEAYNKSAGGAIYNSGVIKNVTGAFTNNYIIGATPSSRGMRDYSGGVIHNRGNMAIRDSLFTMNSNSTSNLGDVISNYGGKMIIDNSVFTNNDNTDSDGTVFSDGYLNVTNSIFKNNTSQYGGAIYSDWSDTVAHLFVDNTQILNNTTVLYGSAIRSSDYTTIKDSTILNNTSAVSNGGAIYLTHWSDNNTLNIIADNSDVVFKNNKSVGKYVDISVSSSANSVLNFNAAAGKQIAIGGEIIIDGYNSGSIGSLTININKSGLTYDKLKDDGTFGVETVGINQTGGKYVFYNTVSDATMNLYNGADVRMGVARQANGSKTTGILDLKGFTSTGAGNILDTRNVWQNCSSVLDDSQPRHSIDLGNVVLNTDTTLRMDFNVASVFGDQFTATSFNGSGNFILDRFQINGETSTSSTGLIADSVLKDHIQLATDAIVYSIYKKGDYDVSYDQSTGNITFSYTGNGTYNLAGFLTQDSTGTVYNMTEDEFMADGIIHTMAGTDNTKTVNAGNYVISGANKSGVSIDNNQTLNINGGIWDDFYNSSGFGNVFKNKGTLNVNGGTYENNRSDSLGGVIENDTNGVAVIKNALFRNNIAGQNGGAIHNREVSNDGTEDDVKAHLTVENSTFIGNSATGVGGAVVNCGYMSVTDSVFRDNNADKYGGAVHNAEYNNVEGYISAINSDVIFDNNSAGIYGGAIYNNVKDITITANGANFEFTNNSAKEAGGAIFNKGNFYFATPNGNITFKDNYVVSDTANALGGAVFNTMGNIYDLKADFIGNYVIAPSENALGGAVYNEFGNITHLQGNFLNNYAQNTSTNIFSLAQGGAVYNGGIIGAINETDGTVSGGIVNSVFKGNYVKAGRLSSSGSSLDGGNADGGAIYNNGTLNVLSQNGSRSQFLNNYALSYTQSYGAHGGAVYNNADAVIETLDADFSGNYIKADFYEAKGGAIFNQGNIGAISGTFDDNFAESHIFVKGGAIHNDLYGSIESITGAFNRNYVYSTENSALGGAISNFNENEGNLYIGSINADFTDNYAKSDNSYARGGAIGNYTETVTAEIGDITGTFTRNYAESVKDNARGGAIFNNNEGSQGAAKIGNISGTFIDNYAKSGLKYARGGAIYNYSDGSNTASIASISGVFSGNYAKSEATTASTGYARGGAIYNAGTINGGILDSSFSGNYVSSHKGDAEGGAIWTRDVSLKLINSEKQLFENNYAAATYSSASTGNAYGGAIYNNSSTLFGGSSSSDNILADFSGNFAKAISGTASGGAVYNKGTIYGSEGDFTGNYAQSDSGIAYGGAIYNNGTFYRLNGNFENNYVKSISGNALGGALYNEASKRISTGITGNFIGNYAVSDKGSTYGGAIYNLGTINAIKGNFTGNYLNSAKTAQGAAIYNAESGDIGNFQGISGNFSNNNSIVENGSSTTYGAIVNLGNLAANSELNGIFSNNSAVANATARGGAIYNGLSSGAKIGNIIGSFNNNSVDASTFADGGAIHNNAWNTTSDDLISAIIGNITADFSDNFAIGKDYARGGAIFNTASVDNVATIGSLSGAFDRNYVLSKAGKAKGGAILNEGVATIQGIRNSSFTGNYAQGVTEAAGGALHLSSGITSGINNTDFTNNYAISTGEESQSLGGAIYNSADESNIVGDFSGNYVQSAYDAAGGAIWNSATISDSIQGSFINNHATADNNARGGAVYNAGSITTLMNGTFEDNYVSAKNAVWGGAIFNEGSAEDDRAVIDHLSNSFTGNYATSESSSAYGGAIYNNIGDINTIRSSFEDNRVIAHGANGKAFGGAIYNGGVIDRLDNNTSFNYNYAEGTIAYGGAIYNTGTVNSIYSNFTGNYISNSNNAVRAGAIYNTGTLGCLSGTFEDNYVQGKSGSGGAIYNELATINSSSATFKNNKVLAENYGYGGAIYNKANVANGVSTIGNLYGSFQSNSVTGVHTYGGAICNYISDDENVTASITSIGSGFIGNYTAGSTESFGGAIYNLGSIKSFAATVNENHASSADGYARGGVIYNAGTIGDINEAGIVTGTMVGSFISNFASGKLAATGGMLYNTGTIYKLLPGTYEGNYAYSTDGMAAGGVIYNTGIIGDNDDDLMGGGFTGNYAKSERTDATKENALGGAIYNSTTGVIAGIQNGWFRNNYVEAVAGNAVGGAIYNRGLINSILMEFSENSASGDKAYGGAIYNLASGSGAGIIGSITGSAPFSSNFASGTNLAFGGAIENQGIINNIETNFYNNYAESDGRAYGGAIYNTATIGSIDETQEEIENRIIGKIQGDFRENYVSFLSEENAANAEILGGAIYNSGLITDIDGNFEKNYAKSLYEAKGGAIYNAGNIGVSNSFGKIKSAFTGNYALSEGTAYGGAIYNAEDATVNRVYEGSSFTENYVQGVNGAYGGAIYNLGKFSNIFDTNFSGNYAKSTGAEGESLGGAIYNTANQDSSLYISGNFSENYAQAVKNSVGGAIYNDSNISYIYGTFEDNYATSENSYARGGAIANLENGSIDYLAGTGSQYTTFDGNYVTAKTDAFGGAIYNEGTIKEIHRAFKNNYAEGDKAYGGAIYSSGNLGSYIESEFNSNHVLSLTNDARGGAIYNTGTMDMLYGGAKDNYAKGKNAYGGAIYNEMGTITNISSSSYENNSVIAQNYGYGGAVYNAAIGADSVSTIGNMHITFKSNHVSGRWAYGGALYNYASDETATASIGYIGSYNDNYTEGSIESFGGAIYNNGSLGSTSGGDRNYALSTEGAARGGMMYNEGTMSSFTGNFRENYASGKTEALGGVLYNSGVIANFSAGISDNYVTSGDGAARGGLFYNTGSITGLDEKGNFTGSFGGSFTGNHAIGATAAEGGAFYNSGSIYNIAGNSYSGNYATSIDGVARGGVFVNAGTIGYKDAEGNILTKLQGGFNNNYVSSDAVKTDLISEVAGGAIYNTGTITSIENAGFTSNYAEATKTLSAKGGAIANYGNIGYIGVVDDITKATFNQNEVRSAGNAYGGAIFNENLGNDAISSITASFVSNSASGATGAYGGAIYTTSDIGNINAIFNSNSAISSEGLASGGALWNSGSIESISGDITSNSAIGLNARGGAIYNIGTLPEFSNTLNENYTLSTTGLSAGGALYNEQTDLTLKNITVTNNYSKTENGTAQGGAIWTSANLTVLADNDTSRFEGNYIQVGEGEKINDAVYLGSSDANFALEATNSGKILFYDNIDGTASYTLTLNGDTDSKIDLLGLVKNASTATLTTTHLTISENTFSSNGLMFQAQSGYVELQDNEYKTYTIDKLSSDEAVNWNLDIDILNEKSDVIKTNQASSGKIYIDNVSVAGIPLEDGKHKVQILDTQTSALQLALNEALTEKTVLKEYHVDGLAEITKDVDWNHKFYDGHYDYTMYGQLGLDTEKTENDSISYTISTELTGEVQTLVGDTLRLWNTNNSDAPVKNFNFFTHKDKYVLTDNVGESVGTVLNINGVSKDTEKSTIDFGNEYTGFVLSENKTLNVKDVNFINVVNTEGSVIDALEGSTVNLNGVTLSSSDSTAIVKNDGTLNFTGNTSTINASITGSNGITNIDTAVDIVSESGYAITQKTVNVNDGGTLSVFNNAKIAADLVINDGGNAYVGVLSITKDVTNDGGLHLYGATALTKAIDGAGTTYIYNNANITNEGGINQAVTVTSGSTLINEAALGSAEGKITNAGTITSNADYIRGAVENNNALSLLGGELSKAVTGSGTTTITDSMTNSGGINQSVVVNENVTLTNKSALGSETGNITNAGTITSNADYINGAVENNNALSLLGGELAKVVTGSGTTTVSGNTTNAGGINQAVTVTSGSTLTNKAALGSEEGKITNAGTITSNANYINGAVENNNALSLLGGELAKAVTGSGTTTVSGNTTNSGGINQAVVVEENVTLTNKAALGSETGKITNSGTIISSADDINGVVENNNALKLSGGELVKAVTGLGTTTITDSMTNSGGINQAVVVNENVTLTNKAALGSEEGKITNAGVINTSAANINGVVENNNNLTLTEGTLDKAVSGAGTTNVIGEVINEAVISQNVAISSTGNLTNNNKIGNVVNDGILTSDTSNLTGTIRNNKTLNLTGTLDKAVTGNGTTYVGEDLTLTLVNGADIEGVLNASSGSTILVSGSGTDRYGIGRLTGNGDVEVTGGNLTIRNKASLHNLTNSGTTTIEGTLVATGDILNNSNSNLTINGNTKAENVTNKGDMDVLGSLVVDEKLYNSGTLDIAGKLQANEVENDNGTINVEENATLDVAGDLTTNEDITTSGNLWVVGDITAKNLTNEGDLSVGGDVDVTTLTNKDNADIAGDVTAKDLINEENAILSIEKNAEVETLTNAGTATIDGDLIASGNVSNTKLLSVGKDLTTEGDVINNGTLEVTGSVSAVNITTKNATVHGDLTASSNVTTTKSLTVDGHVTANNFTNDTDGVVTLKQGAEVNDFTNKGTATVTGNLAANEVDNKKSLEVSGSLTAKSDITNDTDATLIIKNGAEVGDLTNKGTTTVTGKVTASDVTNEKTLTFNSGAEINDMLNSGAATVVNGFVANDITNSSILNVQGGTVSINNVINTSTLNISDKAKVILQTKITGEGGKVNITDSSITTNGNIRNQEVSATNSKLTLGDNGDVLKTSKLNLKNSTLDTRDNVFTNYIIDEIHATSDSRFSIDINLSRDEQNSDTFTLANGGSGVIYLSSLKVTNNCEDNEIYKIQIIKSGRDDAPQLAYDNSKVLDHANAHMRDDMLFAKNFGLVTTDTLNDTIEIRGWRDTFGEWADFKVDEDKSFTFVNDETYQLSRDVLGFEGINGTIIGQNKTFDIDNHVWFEEIKEDQTIKITDLNIVNNKGEMNNKGHLLLDNVLLDKDIQNNKTLELKNRVVLEKVTNNADLSYEGEILTIKDLTNNSNVVIDATKALIGKLVNNSETTIDGSLLSPSIKNNAEGTLKVTDDVTAETVTNNGVAELGKDLTVSGKLTTTKSLAVSGKLSSDMVENEGVLEVGSGLQTKEILNKGTAAVTGKTVSETLTNSGNMTLTGDVLSKSITNEDTLTITGDLTAAGITNNKELNVNESAINVGKISAKESGDLNITNSTLNAYDTIKNQNITATKSTMNIVNPYYMINDSLRMLDSTLNMGELEIKPLHINTMDLTNSTINIASSKVDFDSNTMGRITSDTVISDNSTIINLNNLNPQNYPSKEVELVKIPFADTTYSGNVSYNGQTSLQAPIYKYGISYDPRTGDMVFVRGGSYNPNTGKIEHSTNPSDQFNPNVLSTGVAAHTAATSTMNQVYNYVFQNSDNFMHYPLADRMAVINRDKYALNEMPAMMDETVPFESAIGMNSEGSSWFKPYVNFETVDYKKGPRVHATNYGSLAGFDSSIRTYKNGWSGAYTGYVGYTGSMQSFGGIHSNQNGALVGGTFTLYKGNFFSATTLSAGVNLAETNSGLGHDDITMLLGGAANKTGYNFEFKEGRYIFQPNVMVSYTFVNAFNYINTSGVEIKSDPMHTIQVAPGFRMMANTKRGWQPYIAVNMVMNFMDKAKVSADDIRLPGMSTRPYVQYGIGVQKTFKDNFMAFGQTMFQSGGRHGVTLTAGFRWMLDSKPKTKDKVEIKNDQLVKTIKGSPLVGSIKEVKIQKESQTQYEQLESGKTIIKQLSKQTVPQRGYKTTQTAIRGTLKQI